MDVTEPLSESRAKTVRRWSLVRSFHTEALEGHLGFAALLWGGWVLNPWFDAFAVAPPLFRALLNIMPRWWWGWMMAAIGLVQVVGVVGYLRNSGKPDPMHWFYTMRQAGAFLGILAWVFLGITIWMGDHRAVGAVFYIWSGISWGYVFVHLRPRR